MELTEDLFYTYLQICSREDNLPIRTFAKFAIVDKTCYEIITLRLNKKHQLYEKYKSKFASAVYRRWLRYPFIYNRTISSITKFAEARFHDEIGIQLFDHDPVPFKLEFMQHNRIAVKNIILWCLQPQDFESIIFIYRNGNACAIIHNTYTVDNFIPLETSPRLYMLDMELPLRNNQFLIGSPIIPHTSLHLGITKSINQNADSEYTFENDVEFYDEFINRVIVVYDTVDEKKYNFMNYRASINVKPHNYGIRTRTIINEVTNLAPSQ
jgi:hypothetical protein